MSGRRPQPTNLMIRGPAARHVLRPQDLKAPLPDREAIFSTGGFGARPAAQAALAAISSGIVQQVQKGYEKYVARWGDIVNHKYRHVYLVKTLVDWVNQVEVFFCPGLPQINDVYLWNNPDGSVSGDLNSICQSIVPQQIAPLLWEVTCEWSPLQHNRNDPTQEPPRPSGGDYTIDTYPQKDCNGNAIVNSAGFPYSGVVVPLSIQTFSLQRKVSIWSLAQNSQYSQIVNSDPIGIYGAGQVKNMIRWRMDWTPAGVAYFVLDITAHFHPWPNGWQLQLIDQGPFYISFGTGPGTTDEPKAPTDKQGNILPSVLLDGTGYKLDMGNDPVWNNFTVLNSAPVGWLLQF